MHTLVVRLISLSVAVRSYLILLNTLSEQPAVRLWGQCRCFLAGSFLQISQVDSALGVYMADPAPSRSFMIEFQDGELAL